MIPATGHDYGNWVYVNDSLHKRVCKNDNYHEETGEHSWDEGVVIKAATKDEAGVRTFTCEGCGGTKAFEVVWIDEDDHNTGTESQAGSGTGSMSRHAGKKGFKLSKRTNPLSVKGKTVKVKYGKLKKRNQTFAAGRVIKITKRGQGRLSYKLTSAKKGKKSFKKKIRVNSRTGKVTLKKGLRKGIYKVSVKVKAAGNAGYSPSSWKMVTFRIKVR